jgi:hypothetical protein
MQARKREERKVHQHQEMNAEDAAIKKLEETARAKPDDASLAKEVETRKTALANRKAWHVDNLCEVTSERTVLNTGDGVKETATASAAAAKKMVGPKEEMNFDVRCVTCPLLQPPHARSRATCLCGTALRSGFSRAGGALTRTHRGPTLP